MLHLADIQDQIRSGDVFLFRGNRLFSRLIRWKTQSVYSHVGVALWIQVNGAGRRLAIMEALEGVGVRLYPLDVYLADCAKQQCPVEWFQVTDPAVDREKIAAYVLSRWGRRYASWRQFVVSFSLLSSIFRRWWGKRPYDTDPDRDFCSELCTAAFEDAGYTPDEGDLPANTDPGAVSRFTCLQRRGFLTL